MNSNVTVGRRKLKISEGWLSILPVIFVLIFIRFYPMVMAFYRSFTNWDGMYRSDWVGLKNYIQIFTDSPFWTLFRNSLVLLLAVPLQLFFGLFVAVLLYEEVTGWRAFRVIIYLPQIVAAITIGYLFRVAFGLDGPVNVVLRNIRLLFSRWRMAGEHLDRPVRIGFLPDLVLHRLDGYRHPGGDVEDLARGLRSRKNGRR